MRLPHESNVFPSQGSGYPSFVYDGCTGKLHLFSEVTLSTGYCATVQLDADYCHGERALYQL
jgi:hypothetical protein